MAKTPNYCLIQAYNFYIDKWDTKILPQGMFVRPVELCYVPDHVREDHRWRGFNPKDDIFVYTKYGFVVVPKSYLRET